MINLQILSLHVIPPYTIQESTFNRFEDEISTIPTEFLPGMDQPANPTIMSSSLKLFQSPNPDMSMLSLLSSDPGPGLQAGDIENRPIQEETGAPAVLGDSESMTLFSRHALSQ